MRKDSGHVVRCLDQSASFRIFDSTFYRRHSAFRNSAFYQHPIDSYRGNHNFQPHRINVRAIGGHDLISAGLTAYATMRYINRRSLPF